jgi:hypothetical protein
MVVEKDRGKTRDCDGVDSCGRAEKVCIGREWRDSERNWRRRFDDIRGEGIVAIDLSSKHTMLNSDLMLYERWKTEQDTSNDGVSRLGLALE